MIAILIIIVSILLLACLILRFHPAFGGRARKAHRSNQIRNGKFDNQIPTVMESGLKNTLSILRDFAKGNPQSKPAAPLPAVPAPTEAAADPSRARITWFGHSALLLEMQGRKLLLDPMFGTAPSPFPAVGGKRYPTEASFDPEKLPAIDAVLLSHDHYDHLDYGTIRKLRDKVGCFYVPLGVGSHLERWGIAPEKIQELDWWQEAEHEGLRLACTPARHFSGRSLTDRNATLWCSWVIAGERANVYFSGDSGYGPHFQEIGDAYGPFDLTLMECGQYDQRWAAIHMMPEETVQAHLDLKGDVLLPIHWGAFTLSFHSWTEPVERVTRAAKERNVRIATPRIGEGMEIGSADAPADAWWKEQEGNVNGKI